MFNPSRLLAKHPSTAAALMIEAGQLAEEHRDDLLGRVGKVFARREPFQQAGKYVQGLMDDLPRNNGWTLAEAAGDARPDKTQRLLNHAAWDEYAAMGVVRDFVIEHLTVPATEAGPGVVEAVAVLDETGQEKKVTATAGAKRQYVGCAGRVANAVNIVYCTYAPSRGHAQVGARLYVPKEQAPLAADPATATDDEPVVVIKDGVRIAAPQTSPTEPCTQTDESSAVATTFRTKPQLAVEILTDFLEARALGNGDGYDDHGDRRACCCSVALCWVYGVDDRPV